MLLIGRMKAWYIGILYSCLETSCRDRNSHNPAQLRLLIIASINVSPSLRNSPQDRLGTGADRDSTLICRCVTPKSKIESDGLKGLRLVAELRR